MRNIFYKFQFYIGKHANTTSKAEFSVYLYSRSSSTFIFMTSISRILHASLCGFFVWYLTAATAWSRTTTTTATPSSSWHSSRPLFFSGRTPIVSSKLSLAVTNMSGGSNGESSSVRVLGVCGGIGSGKSMACKLLVSDLGCLSHLGTL